MKYCTNCGEKIEDNSKFCSNCGTSVVDDTKTYSAYKTKYDHTDEFDAGFVQRNKLIAASTYIFGFLGIIIALLAQGDSHFFRFHVKQSLKYQIILTFLAVPLYIFKHIPTLRFFLTIPIILVLVLNLCSFFVTLSGRSVEPPIIRYFGWFK